MAKDNAGGSSFLASLRGGILIREHPRKSAVEPSDHRIYGSRAIIRSSFPDQCHQCLSAVSLCFCSSPQNKNGSPGSSCRFSDEGAPSERLGKNKENHLLHVHVFRQPIELACRVPRLNHPDVSAFGSGYLLVKGRAGRRAHCMPLV
jgi:hypothetical protein